MKINRILTQEYFQSIKEYLEKLNQYSSDVMSRKIPNSLVQHCHILKFILEEIPKTSRILCVGSYEDPIVDVLRALEYSVVDIDPMTNVSLEEFVQTNEEKFDLVFSTSVIEHVPDDLTFLLNIKKCMAPYGKAILTCDFKSNWLNDQPVPTTSLRFYNDYYIKSLLEKTKVSPIDDPEWSDSVEDFQWEGINYTFACFGFKNELPN